MQDPLNVSIQLGGIDATIPLLPEGNYQCQIKESVVAPNKDKTGLNWNLKLGLASAATATDGRPVAPDFPLFVNNLGLQPGPEAKDPEAFKRNLCNAVDSIFNTDQNTRADFSAELVANAVGKVVVAHVVIDEWQGNKTNKVSRLVKAVASPL